MVTDKLTEAAQALVDFDDLPREAKRPDVFAIRMRALRTAIFAQDGELAKLAAYFRDEAPSDGFVGDVEGWSPVDTAIAVMRRTRLSVPKQGEEVADCPVCSGTGLHKGLFDDSCDHCAGEGTDPDVETVDDKPIGAIENGREHFRRMAEHYDFECEGGPLVNCYAYQEAQRCFEHMAEWISSLSSPVQEDEQDALVTGLGFMTIDAYGNPCRIDYSYTSSQKEEDHEEEY